jgi:hypothetical protein
VLITPCRIKSIQCKADKGNVFFAVVQKLLNEDGIYGGKDGKKKKEIADIQ